MKNYLSTYEDPFFNPLLFHFFDEPTSTRSTAFPMRADITQDKENYYIDIEMPGVKKNDINISLKDGNLTVEVSREYVEKEGVHFNRKERFYGKSSRTFYVGDATEKDINANYVDGVLTLKIATNAIKKEEEVRKIAIN